MKELTDSVYTFADLRQGKYLYVDKTEYVWKLVRSYKGFYFLSRPRRFGKSLTVSTLKAIFEGRRELFDGLAISKKEYDWKPYPVIHLDLNGWSFHGLKETRNSLSRLVQECAEDHHIALNATEPCEMFREFIRTLSSGEQKPVVLIDEYDKPILNNISAPHVQDILNELKAFYSVIKAFENSLRFVFITGVTKFCHVSLFSDLNNLTDITMHRDYATMFGYTQSELEHYFSDRIEATAQAQKVSVEELKRKLKAWYDGYCFEETSETVYNPVSIAKFFENDGKFDNYWFATGTPSFLMELAKKTDFNFEDAVSKAVPGVTFDAFEIPNIDPVTLLLQTGYLTIKSSEIRFNKRWFWLDFPNEEVAESFSTYLLNSYVGRTQREVSSFSADLATAFLEGNLNQARKVLESFFAGVPYTIHKKSEATFQTVFYAIFRLLGFNIEAESCTNDGRIDAVVQTDDHIYLFEFKLDDDETALSQIKDKAYFKKYLQSSKKITLIGVNFDSEKGQLIDWQTEDVVS